MVDERRQFSRIPFQAEGRVYLPDCECSAAVLDISLKGALLDIPPNIYAAMGASCTLRVRLDELGPEIRMEATVVHRQGGHLGLHCREMDLDSITHLRRLVELNLGDEAALHRELGRLSPG